MTDDAATTVALAHLLRYEHVEQVEYARVKQIAFLLVLQEYLDDLIKEVLLDHIQNAVGVFGQDDCLKELNNLYIRLD